MKAITAILFLLLALPLNAQAQIIWHGADQITVEWDAPDPALADGSALPVGDSLAYRVYYKEAGNPQATPIEVTTAPIIEQTLVITVPPEIQLFYGVRALRMRDGSELSQSEYAWSNDPDATGENPPWGVVRYMSPGSITNLGKQ